MAQMFAYLVFLAVAALVLAAGAAQTLFPALLARLSLTRLIQRISGFLRRRPANPVPRWLVRWTRIEGVLLLALGAVWLVNLHPQVRLLPRPPYDPALHRWQAELPDGTGLERREIGILTEVVRSWAARERAVDCAGMCVGVVHGDRGYFLGVGRTHAGDAAPPDADTLFEIGSITKTFTGAALAALLEEGAAGLDDPVAALLPGWVIPEKDGRRITLRDLATHRSGLPRMPDLPMPGAVADLLLMRRIEDPYRNGTAEWVRGYLAEYALPRAPGDADEYSNLAMGLLGHALARQAGLPYGELVRRRVLAPLGMDDTAVTLDPGQAGRLAQGYIGPLAVGPFSLLSPVPPWTFADGFQGCGALKSTARDLLKYLRANLAAPAGPLGPVLERVREPLADVSGLDGCTIGLGMLSMPIRGLDDVMCWHNGGTGGYSSFLGFSRKHQTGVVMLATGACDEALGHDLLRALANDGRETAPPREAKARPRAK